MFHFERRKQILKEGNQIMQVEKTYIESDDSDCFGLDYNNYRFDKESMESMAREAERILETYKMEQELKALEEENYYALSELYRGYSTLELIKKLFR